MEKLTVNNRVFVPAASGWRMASKYILVICGVIILLGAAMGLLFGDKPGILGEVIFPLVLVAQGVRMSGRTEAVMLVPLEICLEKGEVVFVYPGIDRRDGRGMHRETYTYREEDIRELKSSRKRKALCVAGLAEYRAEYSDGAVEHINGREKGMCYDFFLSLPDDAERKRAADGLQKSLSRIVYECE